MLLVYKFTLRVGCCIVDFYCIKNGNIIMLLAVVTLAVVVALLAATSPIISESPDVLVERK